jgi:hypothetical protein
MNKVVFLTIAAMLAVAGCGRHVTPAPSSIPGELVFEAIRGQSAVMSPTGVAHPTAAQPEKSWIDNVDIDKVFSNPWLIAGVFLLVQWFEIWYFNRTGRKSRTIDAAEAAMQPKLGIIQRILYRIWRWIYFWKNKDKKDPDKEEEENNK